MKFSKLLMEKFGLTIRKRKNELFTKYLIETNLNPFYYLIDWKALKYVNLMFWFRKQINTPGIEDQIIVDNKWNEEEDEDILIVKILQWVRNNFTYIGDQEAWGTPEHFDTIEESLNRYYIKENGKWKYVGGVEALEQYPNAVRGGDCEAGAIMITAIARKCGISHKKIKIICSNVVGGGHAYTLYCDEFGRDVIIDWCYWPNTRPTFDRLEIWEEPNYFYGKKMWFAFNDQQIFKK